MMANLLINKKLIFTGLVLCIALGNVPVTSAQETGRNRGHGTAP